MPFALELLLAVAFGSLHSLPFVWTQAWPLQLTIMALLAWRVAGAAQWRAAALGLAFGTAWLCAGTWWLYISMHRYGGLPAWLTVVSIVLLCAALSFYLAAAMAVFVRWRSGRAAPDALLFAALWLLAELARGIIFTGFPWVASGYAHVDGPLAALASWLGVYGIGCIGAGLAAWVGLGVRSGWHAGVWPASATLALLVAASFAGPGEFTQPGSTLRVTLLQSNVAQDEKFVIELIPKALEWAREQLLAAEGDLVVAPETIIPLLPEQLDPGYWGGLLQHFQQGHQAALIGLPLGSEAVGYTNSAAGISAGTKAIPEGFYRYDKHHLVPFGEFIPDGFKWFTRMMNIPLGDFNRGPRVAPSFAVGPERVAANICYEDLFGEELAARFTDAATAPTIFANISNIGWFGETIAVAQHLHISRMRALEFQRPMLRATNTGATVVIDHTGRVTHQLAPFTQGALEAQVQGRTGLTPFARWASLFGLWPEAVLALGIVAAHARRRHVRKAL
jgi:apolipoprotein N-acyltransferase